MTRHCHDMTERVLKVRNLNHSAEALVYAVPLMYAVPFCSLVLYCLVIYSASKGTPHLRVGFSLICFSSLSDSFVSITLTFLLVFHHNVLHLPKKH